MLLMLEEHPALWLKPLLTGCKCLHATCIRAAPNSAPQHLCLQAVDRSTLLQLRGTAAKGYAFDKRFGQDETSSGIYDGCIKQLVESCFKVGCTTDTEAV